MANEFGPEFISLESNLVRDSDRLRSAATITPDNLGVLVGDYFDSVVAQAMALSFPNPDVHDSIGHSPPPAGLILYLPAYH